MIKAAIPATTKTELKYAAIKLATRPSLANNGYVNRRREGIAKPNDHQPKRVFGRIRIFVTSRKRDFIEESIIRQAKL